MEPTSVSPHDDADRGAGPPASTSDRAATHIRRLIFDGVLAPGARVPQDEVANHLGISRIPVREALIGLEREGVVTIELYRGAFVNAVDVDTLRDHYELYGLVYAFAAERALRRTSATELASSLRSITAEVRTTEDPARFTQLAVAFHRTVATATGSARIRSVLRSLSAVVPGDFFTLVPEAMAIERRGLPRIQRAVAAADAEGAGAEYRRLMADIGETVVDVFAARGLLDDAVDPDPST